MICPELSWNAGDVRSAAAGHHRILMPRSPTQVTCDLCRHAIHVFHIIAFMRTPTLVQLDTW